MFGDLNIIRFISLVLIFVVSVMFLIVSRNYPDYNSSNDLSSG